MNYQEIDRDMSSYVVRCTINGIHYYLPDDNNKCGTRNLREARRFVYPDHAETAAKAQTEAWNGYEFKPVMVPQAMTEQTNCDCGAVHRWDCQIPIADWHVRHYTH